MIVSAWILLLIFGFLGLAFLRKIYFARLFKSEAVLMVISIIISALSAGVIWGGLFA
jgi:hypothetical protein